MSIVKSSLKLCRFLTYAWAVLTVIPATASPAWLSAPPESAVPPSVSALSPLPLAVSAVARRSSSSAHTPPSVDSVPKNQDPVCYRINRKRSNIFNNNPLFKLTS